MIENGKCGGINMICHRYTRANIPNTPDFRENEAPSKSCTGILITCMGGLCPNFYLLAGFEWCLTKHNTEEGILFLPHDSEIGYLFDVNLKYPDKLNKLHNVYPCCV